MAAGTITHTPVYERYLKNTSFIVIGRNDLVLTYTLNNWPGFSDEYSMLAVNLWLDLQYADRQTLYLDEIEFKSISYSGTRTRYVIQSDIDNSESFGSAPLINTGTTVNSLAAPCPIAGTYRIGTYNIRVDNISHNSGGVASSTRNIVFIPYAIRFVGATNNTNYNNYRWNKSFVVPACLPGNIPAGYKAPTQMKYVGPRGTWTVAVGSTYTVKSIDPYIAAQSTTVTEPSRYSAIFEYVFEKEIYSITLNANGGVGGGLLMYYSISDYNQTSQHSLPTRSGYNLIGLTSNVTGISMNASTGALAINSGVYGNATLTATWSFSQSGKTFNWTVSPIYGAEITAMSGTYTASGSSQQTINIGTIQVKPGYSGLYILTTRTGISFYGGEISSRYNSTTGLLQYVIDAEAFGDFKINIQTRRTNYSIAYELNGGTASGLITSYHVESNFALTTDVTKANYTFGGWYLDPLFSEVSKITNIVGSAHLANLTLYAKWIPIEYAITYNLNGTTEFPVTGTNQNPITYNVESNITFVLGDLSRIGHSIDKWNPASISAGSTGTKTISLLWTRREYNIDIRFNSSSMYDISTTYHTVTKSSEVVTYTMSTPNKPGYTFSKWECTSVEGTILFTFSGNTLTVPIGAYGDYIVDAVWTPNTYNINITGQLVETLSYVVSTSAQTKTFSIPTKTGYRLPITSITLNSDPSSTITGADYIKELVIPANAYGAINITSSLSPITYFVAFNSMGGDLIQDLDATYDQVLGTLPIPRRDGYRFLRWRDQSSNIISSSSKNLTTVQGSTVVLYAEWESYVLEVSYHPGVGIGTIYPEYVSYDAFILLDKGDNFSRTGYELVAWENLENGGFYNPNQYYLAQDLSYNLKLENSSVVMRAVWTELYFYIRFNSNGGSAVTNIYEKFGSLISAPVSPTRSGYTFGGWYRDSSLTTLVVWGFTMPASDQMFYAKWNGEKYNINYELNGGNTLATGDGARTYNTGPNNQILNLPSLATKVVSGYKHSFKEWVKISGPGTISNNKITILADEFGIIELAAVWTVAIRKIQYGSKRLESGKLKFGSSTIQKIIYVDNDTVEKVVYEDQEVDE